MTHYIKGWSKTHVVTLLAALITASATLVVTLIEPKNKSSLEEKPLATPTPTIQYNTAGSECNESVSTKACVANVTVQINSDELKLVKNNERIALRAGDTLRVANVRYCIPHEATVNKIEVKAYLFQNGVEGYKNGIFTLSNLPINTRCHNAGNFQKTWKLEPGQHRVSIPIIKYDGSNRIVDKSFYLNLDVGRY